MIGTQFFLNHFDLACFEALRPLWRESWVFLVILIVKSWTQPQTFARQKLASAHIVFFPRQKDSATRLKPHHIACF